MDAATLQTFLGATLPSTGQGTPTYGQATATTITASSPVTFRLTYSYQTNESVNSGYDSAGYVLNGTYYELGSSTASGLSSTNGAGGFHNGITTVSTPFNLASGSNFLGFVAYNTDDNEVSSGLFFALGYLTIGNLSGLTPNERAIATNLDHSPLTGAAAASFTPLYGTLNTSTIAAYLDQLSPQKLQIMRDIAFNNFGFMAMGLDDHTASLRYGNGGFDMSGLQVLDSSVPAGLSQIKGRLLAWNPAQDTGVLSDSASSMLSGVSMNDPKDVKECGGICAPGNWNTFISGNVVLADVGSEPGLSNNHYTTGSVIAGADYRVSNNWAVGALFGYGHTDADTDTNGSKTRVDSFSPGIYATYADHGWFANGLLSYTRNSYSESRVITFANSTAYGSPTGNQGNVDFDGGYEFHSGNWTYGPTAALQYVHLQVDSFTEQNAGAANLAVNEQNVDSLRSRLGGAVRYNWSLYGGKVIATPHLSASWQHEYLDNNDGITSQFAGQGLGSFTVNTTRPDRDSALVDVGLDTQWNKALTLFVDYQTQAGQSDFFAQSINGGCKVSF